METPASTPEQFKVDEKAARAVIDAAIAEGRGWLSEFEAKQVLEAYDIPVVETLKASNPDEAAEAARRIGKPVALKILSVDIIHKSDIGGVQLHIKTPEEVRAKAIAMLERVRSVKPDARIEGFTVQAMASKPGAHELIVGMADDPLFGPVLLFGQGGTSVEVVQDKALGLPPLNTNLAREMMTRTRVWKLLQGYRDRPPAAIDQVALTLIKISQMITDIAEIVELDINPLLADDAGVLALDARIKVAVPTVQLGTRRLAIRPYPKKLEERVKLNDGREYLLRPVRPEDEPIVHRMFEKHDAGGHPPALLRADEAAVAPDGGTPDADRLRPRNGAVTASRWPLRPAATVSGWRAGCERAALRPMSSTPPASRSRASTAARRPTGSTPRCCKRAFLGWLRGERATAAWSRSPASRRRTPNGRAANGRLWSSERTRIGNRMKSTLARLGIRGIRPGLRKAVERLERCARPRDAPLPPNTLAELRRDLARLRLIHDQIREIEAARSNGCGSNPTRLPSDDPVAGSRRRHRHRDGRHAGAGGTLAKAARPPRRGPLWRTDRIARRKRRPPARKGPGPGGQCPRPPRHAAAGLALSDVPEGQRAGAMVSGAHR